MLNEKLAIGFYGQNLLALDVYVNENGKLVKAEKVQHLSEIRTIENVGAVKAEWVKDKVHINLLAFTDKVSIHEKLALRQQ